ncbi:type II secretion system minor pseudopilin GspI [Trinickia caryophylli]|uniref:Type II secretion system protein I n=1 Tax=Trinickia caryophylli TaxID=28094 RepID=A0A1X7DPL2_TRICW|nr:type II secretion system minor pseudopilin GspI [Trinickia caryophylli]PMS10600.1 type II secretion system protein GspI [Trinickia caryophylli]TRX17226.1 type II secretion system protein GspI [Trinickia caryophylli]WQE12040.1 type II secretion system minor pseudopilin GspI [Trinickia caryophylli]SMF19030.1 type II secretion system protein I (GspI) [Trinickia caryophylli]GLU31839.1 type II secretion system protein GspI [Trinickia caryophylli]
MDSHYCARRRGRAPTYHAGFTLIEVLIALAIVAVALGAVVRAMGALASGTEAATSRLLAVWSADNALAALRVSQSWPDLGETVQPCPQGRYRFVCRQTVTSLDEPLLRAVVIDVYPSASSREILAQSATVMQDERRR